MSNFAAVDLDAVLDDFESSVLASFDETDKRAEPGKNHSLRSSINGDSNKAVGSVEDAREPLPAFPMAAPKDEGKEENEEKAEGEKPLFEKTVEYDVSMQGVNGPIGGVTTGDSACQPTNGDGINQTEIEEKASCLSLSAEIANGDADQEKVDLETEDNLRQSSDQFSPVDEPIAGELVSVEEHDGNEDLSCADDYDKVAVETTQEGEGESAQDKEAAFSQERAEEQGDDPEVKEIANLTETLEETTEGPSPPSECSSPVFESIYDRPNPPEDNEVIAEDHQGAREEAEAVEEQPAAQESEVEGAGAAPIDAPAAATAANENALGEDSMLGLVSPHWVPDSEAPSCMSCEERFTLVRRRHHCRACGKVLCSVCCNDRIELPCMQNKVSRVCRLCKDAIERRIQEQPASPAPPGVLKTSGSVSSTPSTESKQVMFSDGIRPGGDLTELDGSSEHQHTRSSGRSSGGSRPRRSSRRAKAAAAAIVAEVGRSLIPSGPGNQLPKALDAQGKQISNLKEALHQRKEKVAFVINKNLRVHVGLVHYLPLGQELWSYRSDGLCSVGQDEVVILLTYSAQEKDELPQKDLLEHFQVLYEQARGGSPVIDLSHFSMAGDQLLLGGGDFGGFLYFRPTFQSLDGLDLPPQPFLFAVLIIKWEIPWARLFPLRLKLRLGAENRYYPAPIWSTRDRTPVYRDVGNTIMKLLCDFRNYSYSVPIIRGLNIHMEVGLTSILIPKDRYRQIEKALINSNEPVLALGATFSSTADSHLVAVQPLEPTAVSTSASEYETQAINIASKPKKLTGASFVVFNGALKPSSGLSAKSSIVEDGIMVQVTQERMLDVRKKLAKMEDFVITCGAVDKDPDEIVKVEWVDENKALNQGVVSLISGASMSGVSSIRLHNGRDCVDERSSLFIRWTEVFLLSSSEDSAVGGVDAAAICADPPDPMVAATCVARAVTDAMIPALKQMWQERLTPFAVRVTLHPENAGYDAGSKGSPLPSTVMNMLDTALVPIIHGELAARLLSLELVFHILPF